jgi:hypothetical protein
MLLCTAELLAPVLNHMNPENTHNNFCPSLSLYVALCQFLYSNP